MNSSEFFLAIRNDVENFSENEVGFSHLFFISANIFNCPLISLDFIFYKLPFFGYLSYKLKREIGK